MQSKIIHLKIKENILEVHVSKKKIKSLRLKIDSCGKISLSMPYFLSYARAIDFLNGKLDWLEKNLSYINQRKIENNCTFKSGDSLIIWGKNINLKVVVYKKDKIELVDNTLWIYTKTDDYDYIYKKFINWAKKELIKIATPIYNHEFAKTFEQYGYVRPKLKFRFMKSMWGNCKYNKGEITLNLFLVKTPLECLKYVIIHEFAHLLFHDHGEKFKAFLTETMPNWKLCKKELKNYSLNF